MVEIDKTDSSTLFGSLVLLGFLGLGIRWVYSKLNQGGFSGHWSDVEMEGDMRTRIDHGDL
eukprot:CAMPEP_0117543604 /NCGR_PEP_ID=MMETSP0784-20121206/45145_1 /TAXON_ID=39447 /ORGANISM="" /LENGTH=60 /DNA_ID=CAMNT_0005340385 /DNA_START=83 /DNA_END=265 /DNA_ORIENTATION=-